jgi:starvation-inducible outer membrane lipoprotein
VTYCDYIQDEDDLAIHMQRSRISRPARIEFSVPGYCVGAIIGYGGSIIKDAKQKSNTKIEIKRECKYFCGHIW